MSGHVVLFVKENEGYIGTSVRNVELVIHRNILNFTSMTVKSELNFIVKKVKQSIVKNIYCCLCLQPKLTNLVLFFKQAGAFH